MFALRAPTREDRQNASGYEPRADRIIPSKYEHTFVRSENGTHATDTDTIQLCKTSRSSSSARRSIHIPNSSALDATHFDDSLWHAHHHQSHITFYVYCIICVLSVGVFSWICARSTRDAIVLKLCTCGSHNRREIERLQLNCYYTIFDHWRLLCYTLRLTLGKWPSVSLSLY